MLRLNLDKVHTLKSTYSSTVFSYFLTVLFPTRYRYLISFFLEINRIKIDKINVLSDFLCSSDMNYYALQN